MTDRKAKADLLIVWLSDMMSRVEDADDCRVLKDTITFLNEAFSGGSVNHASRSHNRWCGVLLLVVGSMALTYWTQ